MIDQPYGAFAYAYDKALGERYFRAVRRRLDDVLERFPAATKTHLDVACGTGLAMRHCARRGFVSTSLGSPLKCDLRYSRYSPTSAQYFPCGVS